jgi:hypothetical protein
MNSTRPSFSWKFLLCLFLAGISVFAHADTFLNTLAWTRYLPGVDGGTTADELGNTYLIYEKPSTVVTGDFDIEFVRFDISGNAAALSKPMSIVGTPHLVTVKVTNLIGGKRFVYAYLDVVNTIFEHNYLLIQTDDSGVFKWSTTFGTSPFVVDSGAIGGGVDSAGTFYIGYDFVGPPGAPLALTSEFGSVSADIHGQSTPAVSSAPNEDPTGCDFVKGKWSVLGTDNTAMATTPRWCVVDAIAGNEVCHVSMPTVDSGTFRYQYSMVSCTDPAGFVYLGITVDEYRDSTNALILRNHFIRKYTLAGALVWQSKSFLGQANSMTSASNGTVWAVALTGESGYSLEQFDNLGNRVTQTPAFSALGQASMVADPTGDYLLFTDPLVNKRLEANRVGLTGTILWNLATSTAGGQNADFSKYISAYECNGNLYTAALLPTNTQIAVQRFVQGSTLSSLSGGTVSGGANFTLKVSLNAPAPTGGLAVKLTCNNANLRFSNGTTAITAAIPVGSIFVNVPMHSLAVAGPTPVILTGNQNGVVRQSVVNLTP